jgi:hypothetical protein
MMKANVMQYADQVLRYRNEHVPSGAPKRGVKRSRRSQTGGHRSRLWTGAGTGSRRRHSRTAG